MADKRPRKPRSKPLPKPEPISQQEPLGEDEEMQEFAEGIIVPVIRRNRGGRPPRYRPEYARIAGLMLKRGATISELAEAFGVSNRAIHWWQTQHAEFLDQFLQLSEFVNTRVERSLAERAIGYSYDAVKIFHHKGKPVIVPTKEHVPPDISAIKYFLTARKPKEWQIKDQVEVTGDDAFRELFMKMGMKKETKDD